MEILILLIFLSGALVMSALVLFAWTLRARTFDHSDRLALLPLDDAGIASSSSEGAKDAGREREKPQMGGGTKAVKAGRDAH